MPQKPVATKEQGTISAQPSLVVHPHALVGDGRISVVEAFLERETLGAYIKRTGVIVPAGPVVVWHNGYRVPDALWRRLIPRTGDQVVIRARVLGGGGGSKILRTVAMIALVVVASWAAGAYGAAFGGALGVSAATGGALISAGVMIGGTLLINALLPPPVPTAAQLGTGQKYESSPTYAISGGRNRMRPWEPMTLIFGRHKVVPDLGASYWTEYVGDDQYLNQVFHLGLQNWLVNISDYRIGDTPISNYRGVQLQAADQSGNLSMFPGNVDTIQGFLLNNTDGWVARTTPIDTNHISVEVAAVLFRIADDGQLEGRSVGLEAQYRSLPGGAWQTIGLAESNDGYATHYWSLRWRAESLGPDGYDGGQLEYGSTDPAEHIDGQFVHLGGPTYGVWRWTPHPHSLGQPWHGIAPDPLIAAADPFIRMHGAKQEPSRLTLSWGVTKGQYEVRIRKVTGDIKDSRESNETAVGQILCFQPDTANYRNQLRLALRIKATAQLNGAVDEFNCIVQAFCHAWNGSSWVHTHNSNPAWWFLWFARGRNDPVTGDRIYGAGLSDSQIDIEAIKAWGLWCDQKGLTFNYVLDRKMSSAQVLQMIARAGRASPTWQTGKLGAVWDAADLPVVAMFGPFNIKAGTFKVEYINDGTADEIVLNFTNPARGWGMDEVRVKVPGATTTNNPLQLDYEGCTDPTMAGKEANLLAASQIWHRRRVSWETDIEGWVAGRGDVVQMSHDLTVWGYSGRVYGRAGNTLTLDKIIPSDGAGTMMIRDPENRMKTVTVTSGVGDVDTLTITSDMTGFPLPGDEGYEDCANVDWAWFFDPLATPGRRFKITHVEPSEDGVKFQAVDDDPGYYASENNPYLYTPPRDGALLAGVVFSISASESILDMAARTHSVMIEWTLSAAVPVDVLIQVNGVAQPVVRTLEHWLTLEARSGDLINVAITPVSVSRQGTPKTFAYTVVGAIPAPIAPAQMIVDVLGTQLRLSWPRSPSPAVVGYEVRDSDSDWGGSGHAFRGDALDCLVDPGAVGVSKIWYVRSINAGDVHSEGAVSVSYTTALPVDTASINEEFADTSLTNATITLDWPEVTPVFGLSAYRVSYDGVAKVAKSNTITLPADWIGGRAFMVQTIDGLGNVSTGFQKTITKLAPNPVANFRAQVIDNNVLLYWDLPAKTTLPIAHVHFRKGLQWATAQDIGTKDGTFTSLQELEAGNRTYWAAVVDTDNYESDPVSVTAQVSQPPDFIFNGSYDSEFEGTKSGAIIDSGALVLPVDTTETWAQHFQTNGWGSAQDQVDSGFPIYIQPGLSSGYYEEVFDYGTILGSSQVTTSIGRTVLAGSPTISMVISVSDDGVDYLNYPGSISIFATNFRFVKLRVDVTQNAPGDLLRINSINVRLDSKQKADGGRIEALSTDVNGTIANFSSEFVDVESITLTPQGTSQRSAVYDFKDTVIDGTYTVSGNIATISATAHGLIVGQKVRLSFTSGTAPNGTYMVSSVTNANVYTAAVTAPNTSGACSTYAQGMRIYLFNTAGERVSGSVSWAARGY